MTTKGMARPSGSQLRRWGKLTMEKHRRRAGLFLAEGGKVVGELIRSGRPAEALLISRAGAEKWGELLEKAPSEIPVFRLTDREWAILSQDPSPEGLMAVAVLPPFVDPIDHLSTETGPLLLLYRVNNPNNLGALLRTAHWFGFRTVFVSEGSCDATNPKAVRASMGSLFHLTVMEKVDFTILLSSIRQRFRVVGSEVRKGAPPHPCSPETALLMGSESHGLPQELLKQTDERWRIPGTGGAESLSLPQAAAILMYECTREGCGLS